VASRFRAAWIVSAFAIGCGSADRAPDPATDLPAVQWQSAHFRYAAWPDDGQACADVMPVLEEHWAFWHATLDLPDPGSRDVLYSKARGSTDLVDHHWCPAGAAACTNGSSVRSYTLMDKHELIHAYLGETMAPPAPLFAEGMAVAFSCDSGDYGPGDPIPWRTLLDPAPGTPESGELYPRGGQLVTYLFTRFGAAALVGFYGRIGALTGADAIASEFQASFGSALDDVWAVATASQSPMCQALWECSREPIPLDGVPQAGQLLCGQSLLLRTLRIAAPVNVAASVRNAPSRLYLGAGCADSSAAGGAYLYYGSDFDVLANLLPGTYLVNMGAAQVSAQALDAPSVGSTCDALAPYAVAVGDRPLIVTASGSSAVARVRFDEPRSGVLYGEGESNTTTIWSCPDCANDSCPPAMDAPIRGVFQGDYVWRMQTSGLGWITAYFHDPP